MTLRLRDFPKLQGLKFIKASRLGDLPRLWPEYLVISLKMLQHTNLEKLPDLYKRRRLCEDLNAINKDSRNKSKIPLQKSKVNRVAKISRLGGKISYQI